MKTVVNPVQIISDFLKSEYGETMLQTLRATNRTILLGAIDGKTITLGKNGFKARQGGREETANAYDVYDVFTAGLSAETVRDDVASSFNGFVHQRFSEGTR